VIRLPPLLRFAAFIGAGGGNGQKWQPTHTRVVPLAGWLAGWCCTERKFYRARVQRLRFDTQAISFKYYETPSYNEWSETLKLAAITAQRVRIVRSAAVGRRLILMRL
jgi:hypothetical protein